MCPVFPSSAHPARAAARVSGRAGRSRIAVHDANQTASIALLDSCRVPLWLRRGHRQCQTAQQHTNSDLYGSSHRGSLYVTHRGENRVRPNPSSSIRADATNWRLSRPERCLWAAHGFDRTRPVWVASGFSSDTGTSPYDSRRMPPPRVPPYPPSTLHLPGPTPNRNPRPRSARSTGQRLNSQKIAVPCGPPTGRTTGSAPPGSPNRSSSIPRSLPRGPPSLEQSPAMGRTSARSL